MKPMTYTRWIVVWRSENRLDGKCEHPIFENGDLVTLRTRRAARQWIAANYGYIAERPDLRAEPHGWKMPVAKKATITVTA